MQRVLIIDDEPALRRTYGRILGAHFQVVAVASAEEAFRLLDTDTRFDAILCDAHLGGGFSGREFYERLLGWSLDLASRTMIMSGSEMDAVDAVFVRAHGCRFVEKPFECTDLVEHVRSLAA